MRSGIILLDKRAGVSSARAIAEVKRACGAERIGHAGTLDPFATGLLIVLVGRATRLARYAQHGRKEYRGRARFGIATDTDDITGAVIREDSSQPPFELIERARERFVGEISQVPPRISAVKVDGERAYRRARAGEEITLTPRIVAVDRFELTPSGEGECDFVIQCSSGTYVRSLIRDIGEAVGSCATVVTLRRTASAPFSIEQAKVIEEMGPNAILDVRALFPSSPSVSVSEDRYAALRGGDERVVRGIAEEFPGELPEVVLVRAAAEEGVVGVLERRSPGLGIVAVW